MLAPKESDSSPLPQDKPSPKQQEEEEGTYTTLEEKSGSEDHKESEMTESDVIGEASPKKLQKEEISTEDTEGNRETQQPYVIQIEQEKTSPVLPHDHLQQQQEEEIASRDLKDESLAHQRSSASLSKEDEALASQSLLSVQTTSKKEEDDVSDFSLQESETKSKSQLCSSEPKQKNSIDHDDLLHPQINMNQAEGESVPSSHTKSTEDHIEVEDQHVQSISQPHPSQLTSSECIMQGVFAQLFVQIIQLMDLISCCLLMRICYKAHTSSVI